jgi:hypothetical protein
MSFVRLIDHDHGVAREERIGENLADQRAVGEKLDLGTLVVATALVKTNTVANFIAQNRATFLCNL